MKKRLFAALLALLAAFAHPAHARAAELTYDTFDSARYANEYGDLRSAFGYNHALLWQHYQSYGIAEGRSAYALGSDARQSVQDGGLRCETFDSARYANDYPDLKCAFGYDHEALWNHYRTYGAREGRVVYNRAGQRASLAASELLPAAPTREQLFAEQMLALVNAERAKYGAGALALADDCMTAAAVRARDFKTYRDEGVVLTSVLHLRPGGKNFTTAYPCCPKGERYGENTYFTYYFTDDDLSSFTARTVTAMSESSDRYLRMINPNFRYAGFSYYKLEDVGQSSRYVVLQEFRD